MSGERAFIDTNVLVYLYSTMEPSKQQKAQEAIDLFERFVSTQVLNEFCNVGIRKLKIPSSDIQQSVNQICEVCNLVYVDEITISKALVICERYQYSYYDSLMLESALECGCDYILTEDMANGQVIEGRLMIRNIFSA